MTAQNEPSTEKPKGGSKFGWSYVKTASECPTKWYLTNLAPWPGSLVEVDPSTRRLRLVGGRDDSPPVPSLVPFRDDNLVPSTQGLVPRLDDNPVPLPVPQGELPIGIESAKFAPALDVGTRFHSGLEAFYLSGVQASTDTGARSLDAALDAAALGFPTEPTEPESEALALAHRLLRDYHKHYGDDAGVQVAFDAVGVPLVEAEFWLDLGYSGYQFTSRLDMVYWQNGYLKAMEHKTTAASGLSKLITRFTLDGQATGQHLQLASHFPDANLGGVTLNAAVKDRGSKSNLPTFVRRDYARTPAQFEKFRLDIVRKLVQIDEWIEKWMTLAAKGMDYHDAALVVFDGTPSGYQCVGMGVSCEFLSICQNREVSNRLLLDEYKPRRYEHDWQNPLRKTT